MISWLYSCEQKLVLLARDYCVRPLRLFLWLLVFAFGPFLPGLRCVDQNARPPFTRR